MYHVLVKKMMCTNKKIKIQNMKYCGDNLKRRGTIKIEESKKNMK